MHNHMNVEEREVGVRLDAEFAKKGPGMDIENGDMLKIAGPGVETPNRFDPEGEPNKNILLETRNGKRYTNLNQTSINVLIKEFRSKNTEDWVGKTVKAIIKPDIVAGKRVLILYLVTENWELDEYGALFDKNEEDSESEETVNLDDDVNPDDVPF